MAGLLTIPALFYAGLFLAPVLTLLAHGFWGQGGLAWEDPYFWTVLRTSYGLATFGTLTSAIFGGVTAFWWSEHRFWGKRFLWQLSLVCFSLPSVLVVLALVETWGRRGWANRLLEAVGLEGIDFYGWPALLLALTFFNFPLFLKNGGLALAALDRDVERAALSLGASRRRCLFEITWPRIRREFQSAAVLCFAYCLGVSFVVVLVLGGGPRFTTVEVALFDAIQMRFDLRRAASWAAVELAMVVPIYLLLLRPHSAGRMTPAFESTALYPWPRGAWLGWLVFFFTVAVWPLVALVAGAVSGLRSLEYFTILASTGTSLGIGLLTALFSVSVATVVAYGERRVVLKGFRPALSLLMGLPLAVSPLVLALGLAVLVPSLFSTWRGHWLPIAALQSVLALPLVYRPVRDAFFRVPEELLSASASLGATRWITFRWVEWPLVRRGVLVGALFAAAFSLGEVGSVILFLTEDLATLPLVIYRWMGQYRFEEALSAGGVLLLLMTGLYAVLGRLERC